ncbi:hypothetical protein QEN19_001004 [Hanseniaspora menglaensis]
MDNLTRNVDDSNGNVLENTSISKESGNNKNTNYEQYLDLQDEEEEDKSSSNIINGIKNNHVSSDYPLDQFLIQEDEDHHQHHDSDLSKKNEITEVDAAVAAVAKIVEQEQHERELSSDLKTNAANNNIFAEEQYPNEKLNLLKNKVTKISGQKKEFLNERDNGNDFSTIEATNYKKLSKKRKSLLADGSDSEIRVSKKQRSNKAIPNKSHNKSTPFIFEEDKLIDKVVEKHCSIYNLTMHDFKELIWKNDNKQQKAKTLFWKTLVDEFPNRTRSSLYKHVKRRYNNFKDRGKWTTEEDLQLKNLCIELTNQWSEIGMRLGRMPEDCRDRYRNYLKNIETKPLNSKNKWSSEEEQKLSEIVDLLTLKSFKVYLNLVEPEGEAIKSWSPIIDRVSSFGNHDKSEDSGLNNDEIHNKIDIINNLVIDSINFNKHQSNSKFLGTLLNSLQKNLIVDNIPKAEIKELNDNINCKYFVMDLKHVINWTFLSDILKNGRSRIQIRYKWKNVIKSRSEALRSSNEWLDNNLAASFLSVIKKASKEFKNGQAYEEEIDWFYVYKLWREEIGQKLSNDLFLSYRCDPMLMRELYEYTKLKLGPTEKSTYLQDIVTKLLLLSNDASIQEKQIKPFAENPDEITTSVVS